MNKTIPTTRSAWRIVRKGVPSNALVFEKEIPIPELAEGEVLVKVSAAALNPVVFKLMKMLPNSLFKRVAESDLAGEIIDANGSEFQVGDQVFGMLHPLKALGHRQGSLATYTPVPSSQLVHRPSNVSAVEAAGLAVTGLTAYQSLFNIAKVEAGHTVFINGGSTSVGAFAIQLAKARGCKVVTSASAKNEEFVRNLGADEFFDYTTSALHEQLAKSEPNPKYHLVLDAVGSSSPLLYTHSEAYLSPNGTYVTVGARPDGISSAASLLWNIVLRPTWLGGVNRKFKSVLLSCVKSELEDLQSLVAEGKVVPVVDSVHQFEDALKAYERIMTGRAVGKVVIEISS